MVLSGQGRDAEVAKKRSTVARLPPMQPERNGSNSMLRYYNTRARTCAVTGGPRARHRDSAIGIADCSDPIKPF
jgi:hypothetical protein